MLTSPTHAPRRALATMRVQGGVESNLDAPRVLHRRPDKRRSGLQMHGGGVILVFGDASRWLGKRLEWAAKAVRP